MIVVVPLWGLKWVDLRVRREQHALLTISAESGRFSPSDFDAFISPLGYRALLRQQSVSSDGIRTDHRFTIQWSRPDQAGPPLDPLEAISDAYDVACFAMTSEAEH